MSLTAGSIGWLSAIAPSPFWRGPLPCAGVQGRSPTFGGGWIICPAWCAGPRGRVSLSARPGCQAPKGCFLLSALFSFFNASIFDKRVGWPSVPTRAARPCRRPTLLAATTGLAPGAASRPRRSRDPAGVSRTKGGGRDRPVGLYGLGRRRPQGPVRSRPLPAVPYYFRHPLPRCGGQRPVRAMRRRCPAGLRIGPLDMPPPPISDRNREKTQIFPRRLPLAGALRMRHHGGRRMVGGDPARSL